MKNLIYALRALSPLHCGIGQGLNDIDLPTARNRVTGHPLVPGSSLKGVLKEEFRRENYGEAKNGHSHEEWVDILFGKEGNEYASAISITDANLLALPVRSYSGTFAYLASPYTLLQLKEMLQRSGQRDLPEVPNLGLGIKQEGKHYKALIPQDSLLEMPNHNVILLEELDLLIKTGNAEEDRQGRKLASKWADLIAPLYFSDEEGQEIFQKRFAIADDNALNFLCETALPVDAHIAIDQNTGTVKTGALWYEETVPAESLFIGTVSVDRSYKKEADLDAEQLSEFLTASGRVHCQIGGKATTGKGLVALDFHSN